VTPLDNREVGRALTRARIVRIATLSAGWRPHLTPLWFAPFGGRLYMAVREGSPAARDITGNPQVALLFEERDRVLRIRGRAVFRKEAVIRRELFHFTPRYFLSPGAVRDTLANLPRLRARLRYYAERGGEGGFIEVTPESAEFLPKPA
jgi:uncharacterized pyridoxamine 5'-phosphate oxidase family protein